MDTYERIPADDPSLPSSLVSKKKSYGGIPEGAGVRDDVILLFEELEEARNNLAQIQSLLAKQLNDMTAYDPKG